MDTPLADKRSAQPAPATIASGIKRFVLWLGGSLAGITALLYAAGYLVTRAHLHMLGLYGFVEFDNDYFLQEGAKFMLAIGNDLGEFALLLLVFAGLALLVPGATAFLPQGLRRRTALRLKAWRKHHLRLRRLYRLRCVAYGVLFLALLLTLDRSWDLFYAPFGLSDMLYAGGVGSPCTPEGVVDTSCLQAALVMGKSDVLGAAFDDLFSVVAQLAVLACLAWLVAHRWRRRAWLVTPFLLAMALFLILLPMDYGALQRPTIYPVVRFAMKEGSPAPGTDELFLVAKSDNAFVAWDMSTRKLLWIPASTVLGAEIVRMGNLFSRPARPVPAKEHRS